MKAKHSSNSNFLKKIIILFFIILFIFLIFFFMKNKKKETINNSSKNISSDTVNQNTTSSIEDVENIDIPDTIENYEVTGKIVFDKIQIEQYILNTSDDEALELGPIKFYGPKLNQPGNFCIAGHNYLEIFGLLENMEKDDTFYVIDKENSQKVTYKIYDKYTVYPDNLDCLNQETNDKREVTLITCTPGNLTRLIIKAKEI